jgi:hypothetical protein
MLGYSVDLHDAGHFGAPMPSERSGAVLRSGEQLKIFVCNAILFADSNRFQAPVSHVTTYGSHVQPEPFGDLFERVQGGFVGHCKKLP